MSLICKKCGYKQNDVDCIESFKHRFPHLDEHDIPYYCGSCQDNATNEEYDKMMRETNPNSTLKVDRMYITLKMDRDIQIPEHYVSVGGYELSFANGESVGFDFYESCGSVDPYDKSVIHFELRDLDTDSFPESEKLVRLLLTSKVKELVECYVYTGEERESEINPSAITEMWFNIVKEDTSTVVEIGIDILSAFRF